MKNFTKFPTLKMTLVLLIGFFVSIAMGLSSCSDTNAQGLEQSKANPFEMAPRPSTSNSQVQEHLDHGDNVTVKTGLVGTVTLNDNDKDLNGNLIVYDVFKGSKGGLYIFRISKETGNEYKSYIKKDSKLYSRIKWE